MTILQLLIITNYSRRIIGFLIACKLYSRYFDTGSDPTPPTQDKNFLTQPNPTQPDPWMDPTHVQLCSKQLN